MSTGTSSMDLELSAITRTYNRVANPTPPGRRKVPKAHHWRSGAASERHARIDSKLELAQLVEPAIIKGTSDFLDLPVTLRSAVYEHALVQDEPVVHTKATATAGLDRLPLVLAYPCLRKEIAQHCSHYLSCNDFSFDLRTGQGLAIFQDWCSSLGANAWAVRSLTLRHWTAWWGFGTNAWTSLEDQTHFSRGAAGELVVSRMLTTPESETCKCTVVQLLALYNSSFKPEKHRAMTSIRQFVYRLRAGEANNRSLTLLDAAKSFANLLYGHSQLLAKEYGLAGSDCSGCFMPKLYLCGNLSTRVEVEAGLGPVFDAKASCRLISA